MHDSEDYFANSDYAKAFEEFIIYNYGDLLHMSFGDYIKLPSPLVQLVRMKRDSWMKKKASILDDINKTIEKEK